MEFKKLYTGEVVAYSGNRAFNVMTTQAPSTPDQPKPPSHTHDYAWYYDKTTHWRECSCGATTDEALHNNVDGVCDVCGYVFPVEPPPVHNHEYNFIRFDEYSHWRECSCGEMVNFGVHSDTNGDGRCDVCNYPMPVTPPSHTHSYSSAWKSSSTAHWRECSCGEVTDWALHSDANAEGKCDVCGRSVAVQPPVHTHEYSDWKFSERAHWRECSCGSVVSQEMHSYPWGSDTCKVCGYVKPATPLPPSVSNVVLRLAPSWLGLAPGVYTISAVAVSQGLTNSPQSNSVVIKID